jgi:hypothetical protein
LIDRLRRRAPRALREEVRDILASLGDPVSQGETNEGWTEQLKMKWCGWFDEMDRQLERGDPPDQKLSVVRAMELDGVGGTTISRLAGGISRRLARGERY